MRRHAPFRVLGLVLAFWFALTGGERAIVELCPMHGNLALYTGALGVGMHEAHATHEAHAAHGSDAHGGMPMAHDARGGGHMTDQGAPAPAHDHAQCGCGGCCTAGLTVAVVPAAPEVGVATEVLLPAPRVHVDAAGPRAPPAYALPFPTGPPRA